MQHGKALQNSVSNEEAQSYANNMIRGIQNTIFSSMNSNQNIRSDTYSVRWRNQSDRMQQDWLASTSSLQTTNAHSFDSSCSQRQHVESQEIGYRGEKSSPSFSPSSSTMNGPLKYYQGQSYAPGNIDANNVSAKIPSSTHALNNVKPGKKCPVCSEINSPKSNWCMECGKAILSVEVRRYDTVGEPCDTVVHSPPHQYRSKGMPIWNDPQLSSPPAKHCSFDDRFSQDNINVMMNNVKLEGYIGRSNRNGMPQENYYDERATSISFDFENPQFEDLHNPNFQYTKNHAVYRRASHDGNCKEREDFYPFDDLLYPEFAIFDPNLGYAFPSSNIVSNGGFYNQVPVYQSNTAENQHPQIILNKKYLSNKRNGNSRSKRKRNKKHQVCILLYWVCFIL